MPKLDYCKTILLIRYFDTCIYHCNMYDHIIITTLSFVPFIISMCMFIHIFSASVYTTMYSLCFFWLPWQLFLCFVECNSREKGVVRPPISRHAPLVRGKPSQRGRGWQIQQSVFFPSVNHSLPPLSEVLPVCVVFTVVLHQQQNLKLGNITV